MKGNEGKKLPKVPRNFRLDAEINAELIVRGETFKQGDRIGDTGVVETALESYFASRKANSSRPNSHTSQQIEAQAVREAQGELRKAKAERLASGRGGVSGRSPISKT